MEKVVKSLEMSNAEALESGLFGKELEKFIEYFKGAKIAYMKVRGVTVAGGIGGTIALLNLDLAKQNDCFGLGGRFGDYTKFKVPRITDLKTDDIKLLKNGLVKVGKTFAYPGEIAWMMNEMCVDRVIHVPNEKGPAYFEQGGYCVVVSPHNEPDILPGIEMEQHISMDDFW